MTMNLKQSAVARSASTVAVTLTLFGAATASAAPVSLGDATLIDSTTSVIYIMSPKSGVEARDVGDGNVLWRSAEAQRPIALEDNLLMAQRHSDEPGTLNLVLLEGNSGRLVKSIDASLPGAVRATVGDRLGEQFALEQTQSGLVWRAQTQLVQGIAPGREAPPVERYAGVMNVDIGKGVARASDSPAPEPRVANAQLAQPLVAGPGRQFYSEDREHVLVSTRLAPGETQRRYRWTIYNLEGKRLGALDAPVSYAPFDVSGERVLFVTPATSRSADGELEHTPLSLRAVSLADGQTAWQAALKDTRYHGPFPP
ncbi:MAG: hypothetical protein AB8G17_15830 [Gammaproteobacteria bacterium]